MNIKAAAFTVSEKSINTFRVVVHVTVNLMLYRLRYALCKHIFTRIVRVLGVGVKMSM